MDLQTESYRLACGMTGTFNLCLRHQASGEKFEYRMISATVLVGSDSRCDFHLPAAIASSKELLFQVVSGRIFYLGLGDSEDASQRIKRRPVGSSSVAVNGFEIRAFEERGANTEIERALDPGADQRSGESKLFGEFELAMRNEGRRNVVVPIDRPVTIMGRSPRCRVSFNTWSASRFHAACIVASDGIWIVDLKSRTGTFVKEIPVRLHRLRVGDRLRIGPSRFEFRAAGGESKTGLSHSMAPYSTPHVSSSRVETLPAVVEQDASAESDVLALISAITSAVTQAPGQTRERSVDAGAIARTLNDMLRVQSLQLEEIRRLTAYLSTHNVPARTLIGGVDGEVRAPKPTPQTLKPTGALSGPAAEPDVHEWFQQENDEGEDRSVVRLLRKILGPR